MVDRYVVSKSRMMRIPCDGPVEAGQERLKLEGEMEAGGLQLDVEIEYPKKPLPRARPAVGHKRGTKLRYK